MTSSLLVIGDREALGWILTESRTAFPAARRAEVANLAPGDEVFLYTTRGAFKNPTRDRGRVIGAARVAGAVSDLDPPIRFGPREFPWGCDLEIGPVAPFGHGVELAPLVGRLEAFSSLGTSWSIRLRRPLVPLSPADAATVREELDDVPLASTIERLAPYTRWYDTRG
ncbi:hypothetical protein Q6350_03550 [Isoptericola sp. b515]|uniref:hypothetical protein n=1 Tax=Isoptericola sp. b515 TaxID=3064652 RepID=UPI0027139971|nr:hypothetical protein [Isoptericola sp. b515]MDO8147498.1 hypothetical protein [Isoptericola sp. b515]